jgi:hypothetical protein
MSAVWLLPPTPLKKDLHTFTMKQIVHHGYTVTATAKKQGRVWRPHARVSWERGRRKLELLDDKNCYRTRTEAEQYALILGKHWVNNRVQAMQRVP